MGENLFQGLPPPCSSSSSLASVEQQNPQSSNTNPPPALKSALKRSKPPHSTTPQVSAPEPGKRLRFKTTTDASEAQVVEAMQKIALHIKKREKFSKASKLAIQLIQAGSVKPGTSDYFFAILEAAMSSSTACTDASVRADYHELFSAAQDTVDCLSEKQRNYLAAWTIRAVVGNDLFTDDSFVFSKAAGRIKESISNLPFAVEDDDAEEAEALKTEPEIPNKHELPSEGDNKEESDPFGLDALIPSTLSKKDEKIKARKESLARIRKEGEQELETKRFLKSKREALILCLEIAARRYKIPWCQTVIDILVKHAFDNKARFTSQQRDAIGKLWASIHEQHNRRKQGKSVTGKLDMNAFESLQLKYANEKISIRRSVGGAGDHRAQQWLG